MTVEELKHIVNSECNTHLNVFFVKFDDNSIEGFATMPWETEALGVLGRIDIRFDIKKTILLDHCLRQRSGFFKTDSGLPCLVQLLTF